MDGAVSMGSDNNINGMMSSSSSAALSSGFLANPTARRFIVPILQIRTAADVLPSAIQLIATGGKDTALGFLGGYILFVLMWLPFWLLSFALSELGIYFMAIATVFLVGRGIIRMIAFPGSSHRHSCEIEKEFNKYSVRMLTTAANSMIDVSSALSSTANIPTSEGATSNSSFAYYEITSLWARATSYRDRVIAVYAEVLNYLLRDRHDTTSGSLASDLTKYGNNKLTGDIGDLSGLTPDARADGKILLEHLVKVLAEVDKLEQHAKPILDSLEGKPQQISNQVQMNANSLHLAATDLRDFLESLRPQSPGESPNTAEGGQDEGQPVDAVRKKLDEQNTSVVDSVKTGLSSIVPMLDPPLHKSIFGFDVQRGCMLARYRGARQLWVQRPGGGMLDVIHFPAKSTGPPSTRNPKAVLYCNPNAGLIEVATGISLAGGNVASDAEGVVNDNCWTDFYTNAGFDVYMFNYAGFGRSYGAGFCGVGKRGGEENHVPSFLGRMQRIFHGVFLSFQPTPDSLRADGLAVGSHLVSQLGVEKLVLHGESIGGMAAAGAARKLSESAFLREKVSLLICDRTFCNLEAVAQRLVGGWSGYAIRALAPLWSTDVTGDFLAANCPKVVATDSADAIIADASSLKSGIAFWKEIRRGNSTTRDIGWVLEAPVQYRMADWENVCVNDSRFVKTTLARTTPPVWPADKHMSLEEGFHFAACAKRIGKLASIEKKRYAGTAVMDEEGAILPHQERPIPIYIIWKFLGCCEGLCGAALGMAVKGGFDCTVAWLCAMLTFGGQTVVEGIEHRNNWSEEEARTSASRLGIAEATDFDCRPPGYESQETETIIHPKPIPEVISKIKKIMEDHPSDEVLRSVEHELSFVLGTLEYAVARLSSPGELESSWKNRHLYTENMMVGSFLNLHCGHNNPFTAEERKQLKKSFTSSDDCLWVKNK